MVISELQVSRRPGTTRKETNRQPDLTTCAAVAEQKLSVPAFRVGSARHRATRKSKPQITTVSLRQNNGKSVICKCLTTVISFRDLQRIDWGIGP